MAKAKPVEDRVHLATDDNANAAALSLQQLMRRHCELGTRLDRLDWLYHSQGISEVSDVVYDRIKREYQETLVSLGINAGQDERLRRVGWRCITNNAAEEVTHDYLVGSLNDAMDEDDFRRFYAQVSGAEMVASPKLDGLTIDLKYEEGRLVRAATRGNGTVGLDVTRAARCFQGVPTRLPEPYTGNIRGEVVLSVTDWHKLDPRCGTADETNPRNFAAGIVARKDAKDAQYLQFRMHGMIPADPSQLPDTYWKSLNLARTWGFIPVLVIAIKHGDLAGALATQKDMGGQYREQCEFWLDGTVFRVNSNALYEQLGVASNRPKGAIAFKWAAEEVETTLRGVSATVGHTGKIALTADLEPVTVSGSKVSNAYLHNLDNVKALNLHVGDRVVIKKAGEIIPQLIRVTVPGTGPAVDVPAACPSCGSPIGPKKNVDGSDTVDLYCLGDECPAQASGKINRWLRSLEIKGVGPEILAALIETGRVTRVAELYTVSWESLSSMVVNGRKFGPKNADALLTEIAKTRTLTVEQFIGSLGVRGLGKRKAELLRAAWKELAGRRPDLIASFLDYPLGWLTNEEGSALMRFAVDLGIPKQATELQAGLDALTGDMGELLTLIDIQNQNPENEDLETTPATGKSFCVTGTLSRPRPQIQDLITQRGGLVKSDVTKNLNYLVVGADAGSKAAKAEKLGVKCISEEELMELLGLV